MRIAQYLLKSLSVMAILFCLSQLTVLFRGYSADWPPLFVSQRGFTLALMVVSGFKYAPSFWLVSILLNKYYWHTHLILGLVSPLSLILSLGLSSYIYRKICGTISPIHKIRDWLMFLFVVIPTREIFSFLLLHVFDWAAPGQDILVNQKYWAMADVLGLVMGFSLFLELFNLVEKNVVNPKLIRGVPALLIGNTVGILPFYLGVDKFSFLEGAGRYVSLFAMTAVGLFSSPLAMSFSILAHAFWVAWSREGIIKSLAHKGVDPSFEMQFYLLSLAAFAPMIAMVVKSKRKTEFSESFDLIQQALTNKSPEDNLIRLGAQNDSVGVALFDLQYRCIQLNEKFAEFTGGNLQSQLGKTSRERLGPSNSKHIVSVFEEVRKTKKPIWNFKVHLEAWDSISDIDLVANYIPVFSQGGDVIAIIVVASQGNRNSDLGSASDLESPDRAENKRILSLAMSHDIQEPLRNISQSLKILNERFKRRSDLESQNFLENALSATTRVREMVQSSLELAQLEQIKLNRTFFEAREIVEDCLKSYAIDIERLNAKISCGPLPQIKGDKILLDRVFCNLLSNSLKYKGERELLVTITANTEQEEHHFIFSDNGVGFDPKYSERIFELYQRLFSGEERQGYGVGLTLSRKIIELHGGKIWAESILGEGATFHFTLPVDR